MTLTIVINLDNDAFAVSPDAVAGDMVRDIGQRLMESWRIQEARDMGRRANSLPIYDRKGNKCGKVFITHQPIDPRGL